jgi:hypothetical protein
MWETIAVVLLIIVLVIIVFFIAGSTIFKYRTINLAEKVLKKSSNRNTEIVKEEDLDHLPEQLRNYLIYTQITGKQRISVCRLKQKGHIRTYPERGWMSLRAEEYFSVDPPAFLWNAKVRVALLPLLRARDSYMEGKGNMMISFLSFITTVNAHGKELDQGALLRYLGEMVWFPTAFLNDNIVWEEIDTGSLRATITVEGKTATAVFHFDEENRITGFTALRYRSVNEKYSLDKWFVQVKNYKEVNGIRVPTHAEVMWKLEEKDYSYFKVKIANINYNRHEPY